MSSHSRGVEPVAVQSPFDSNTPRPPPVEHVGSPSLARPASPSLPKPVNSTLRHTPTRLKSASISQPARPPLTYTHRHTASSVQARQTAQDLSAKDETDDPPSEETNFLTLLAAQERRVLEVKEELQKAEDELKRLKKQWASHESTKRRNEGRRLHQLRPMSTASARVTAWKDDPDGSSAWMYQEMERRKALMGRGRRASRRVFTGSRTPRPLSLVAQSGTRLSDLSESRRSLDDERPQPSETNPDMLPNESDRFSPTSFYRSASSSPQRQSLYLSGGKQLASEWKEGLWTFFEDLKHATVGDEPRSAPNSAEAQLKRNSNLESRKQPPIPSAQDTKVSDARRQESIISEDNDVVFGDVNGLIDVGSASWNEHGPQSFPRPPSSRPSCRSKETPSLPLHTRMIDGEIWDTWDSPDGKQPSSAHSSNNSFSAGNTSPSPQASTPASSTSNSTDATPRQSIGPERKRDSIPWPVLTKLAPGQLRRTASHLMDEWEKSLVDESQRDNIGQKRPARTPSPTEQLGLG